MDLINRYLLAVQTWLPKSRREDILAELSEDIYSQIEGKETELGRKLSDAEVEDVLKRWGNPMLVAERYQPHRQLIGPALLPEYVRVLKWVLGITVSILAVITLVNLVTDNPLPKAYLFFPLVLSAEFGLLTFLYAVRDRFYRPDDWDPHSLAKVTPKPFDKLNSQSVVGLVITAFLSIWWLIGLRFPKVIFGPFFKFAPIWQTVYLPIIFITLAEFARQILALLRPKWVRFQSAARLVIGSAGLIICYLLLSAGNLVEVTDAARKYPGMDSQTWWIVGICITGSIYLGLVISGIVSIVIVLKELRSLIRGVPKPNAVHHYPNFR